MVLSGVPRKKSPVTLPGIDPGTVQQVAVCLNHYAAPDPAKRQIKSIIFEIFTRAKIYMVIFEFDTVLSGVS